MNLNRSTERLDEFSPTPHLCIERSSIGNPIEFAMRSSSVARPVPMRPAGRAAVESIETPRCAASRPSPGELS